MSRLTKLDREQQDRYRKNRRLTYHAKGLCPKCGKSKVDLKKIHCETCRVKLSVQHKEIKDKRINSGVCLYCGVAPIQIITSHSCETCDKKMKKRRRKSIETNWKAYIWNSIRTSARRRNLEFNITKEDIPDMPTICPLLEIPLQLAIGQAKENSPTIDRIDNSKGYVKGNIWIISKKANTMKNTATPQEIEMLSKNLNKMLNLD